MQLCQLPEAEVASAIAKDGCVIEFERSATQAFPFELCAPHAGTDSLDDQGPFQLGDDGNDHDDGPTQWASSVQILSKADELDVQAT